MANVDKAAVFNTLMDRIENEHWEVTPAARTSLNMDKVGKLADQVWARMEHIGCTDPSVVAQAVADYGEHLSNVKTGWKGIPVLADRIVSTWMKNQLGNPQYNNQNQSPGNGGQGGQAGQQGGQSGQGQQGQGQQGQGQQGQGQQGQGQQGEPGQGEPQQGEPGQGGQGEPQQGQGGKQPLQEKPDVGTMTPEEAMEFIQQQDPERAELMKQNPGLPNDFWMMVDFLMDLHKHVMFVGPAGTGKTFYGLTFAEVFNYPLFLVTSPQMRTDVLGYQSPMTAEFIKSQIIKAFTYDGPCVLVIDEFDRAMAEALIPLNSALANDMIETPEGLKQRNPQCYVIATANTAGHGASDDYNTASQLDMSTLDRFLVIGVDYKEEHELEAAEQDKFLVSFAHAYRTAVKAQGISRQLFSYRGLENIKAVLSHPRYGLQTALKVALVKESMDKDTLGALVKEIQKTCNNRYVQGLEQLYQNM